LADLIGLATVALGSVVDRIKLHFQSHVTRVRIWHRRNGLSLVFQIPKSTSVTYCILQR